MSDADSLPQAPSDPEYAAARAAWQQGNWQQALDALARVVARRPWDDDAYTMLGFAARKLGNYPQALAHYQHALTLNPHHRGAMEYLGETYVDMGCVAQAQAILVQLETACRRLLGETTSTDWLTASPEWTELRAAITTSRPAASPPCPLP